MDLDDGLSRQSGRGHGKGRCVSLKATFQKFFVSNLLSDIPLEEAMVEASDNVMITNGNGVICGIGHTMLENLGAEPDSRVHHPAQKGERSAAGPSRPLSLLHR